jgi:PAS domain S-box-containing protein
MTKLYRIQDALRQWMRESSVHELEDVMSFIASARRHTNGEKMRGRVSCSLGSSLAEYLPIGWIYRDTEHRVIHHNRAAEEVLGLTSKQLRGEEPLDATWRLIDTAGRKVSGRKLPSYATLRTGQPRYDVVLGVAQSNSVVKWLAVNTAPVADYAGRRVGVLVSLTDLTRVGPIAAAAVDPTVRDEAELDVGKPRATLATIAKRMGCTVATVSMALRGHPRISEGTRRRVQVLAREVGYRPDPHLGKLMHILRSARRTRGIHATLYALTDAPEGGEPLGYRRVLKSARAAAEALGYRLEVGRVDSADPWSLQKRMHDQGVEGVLVLPSLPTTGWDAVLDWRAFAVVSAQAGIPNPVADSVRPDWKGAVDIALAEVAASGRYRVAAIVCETANAASDGEILWRLQWLKRDGLADIAVRQISGRFSHPGPARKHTPSSIQCRPDPGPELRDWLNDSQADALITTDEATAEWLQRSLKHRRMHVVVLDRREGSRFDGVEQPWEAVGRLAVEQLNRKIQAGLKGLPEEPVAMTIRGCWRQVRPT